MPHEASPAAGGSAVPTVEEKFRRWVADRPGLPALADDRAELSYAELDAETDALAERLHAAGVGPEQVVAVKVARKLEAVVAMLAVQKAGGVYLPLEAAAPVDRNRTILQDSRAVVLFVGEGAGTDGLDDLELTKVSWQPGATAPDSPASAPAAKPRALPGNAAYIIYTSGTTGTPKGVCVPRDLLSEHLDAISEAFGLRTGDRILQFSPVHVDTAVEQALTALTLGSTLVTIDETLSVTAFLAFLDRHRVTVAHIATGYWNVIVNALERKPWPDVALRQMIVGGDRMHADKARAWLTTTGVPLMNAYGPTETVITPMRAVVAADEPDGVPIGTPVGNRSAHILDESFQPCPEGTVGELHLGGPLLARGYLHRPGLTANAFIPDPFGAPGARMYRTGDMVRKVGERILFIGRRDNQLKVRGYRVELGEIETVLGTHPAVRDVAVLAREGAGGLVLVAYVVGAEGRDPDPAMLRKHVAAALPGHMVPAKFVFLPALPMTSNNKIDRKALLSGDPGSATGAGAVR